MKCGVAYRRCAIAAIVDMRGVGGREPPRCHGSVQASAAGCCGSQMLTDRRGRAPTAMVVTRGAQAVPSKFRAGAAGACPTALPPEHPAAVLPLDRSRSGDGGLRGVRRRIRRVKATNHQVAFRGGRASGAAAARAPAARRMKKTARSPDHRHARHSDNSRLRRRRAPGPGEVEIEVARRPNSDASNALAVSGDAARSQKVHRPGRRRARV